MAIFGRQALFLFVALIHVGGVLHAGNLPTYTITPLGSLSGQGSIAYGMNDNGAVVGQSYNAVTGRLEAVVFSGGNVQSLGVEGLARSVNNSGTVVGETGGTSLGAPNGRAFKWDGVNGYVDLGDLGGAYAGAYDINDSGTITGFAYTNPGPGATDPAVYYSHAFKYENGAMTDLGSVSTPLGYSRGHGINEAGVIAGRASLDQFSNSAKHQATWDASGTITSNDTGLSYSTAQQINNNGLVIGNGYDSNGEMRAMVWDEGELSIMGTFGGTDTRAWSVNDDGVIVGAGLAAGAGFYSAMISFDGQNVVKITDLVDTMDGWFSLNVAYDINAQGQIVGFGRLSNFEQQAFLLTPIAAVPVPASVWLFGSALGLLGWKRRAGTKAAV